MGPLYSSNTLCVSSLCVQSDIEEELLDGNHIIITTEFEKDSSNTNTYALVDCGATGYAFDDKEFSRDHESSSYKLKKPRCLEVIDGRPIESGLIIHITKLHMVIAGHSELIPLFITVMDIQA